MNEPFTAINLTPTRHSELITKLNEQFLAEMNGDVENGWTPAGTKNGVEIFTKKVCRRLLLLTTVVPANGDQEDAKSIDLINE